LKANNIQVHTLSLFPSLSLSHTHTHTHTCCLFPASHRKRHVAFRRRLRTTRNPSTIHSGKNSSTLNVKTGGTCNNYGIWSLNMASLSLTLKTRVFEVISSDFIQSKTKQDNLKFPVSAGTQNDPRDGAAL
jgi:hypothetical protein